jgi:WD40 repeat protein
MNRYLIALLTAFFVFINGCKDQGTNITKTIENKMYVYSNSGNTFYLMDYKTFEVAREIHLNIADTISCDGMALSTNRDYLFFGAQGLFPNPPSGFVIYDIKKDKIENLFFTKLNYGIGYFISAENKSEPGLVYVHFRDFGTYSIDLFERKVKELISDEHGFDLSKRIYQSPDGKWTVVMKNYSELEFYNAESWLHDLQFTLNKDDRDSISVYDLEFSKDNRLFITYQLSDGRSRDIGSYFGSYDLETKQLYRSSLKFPWSLNPYYTAYSPNRNEVYTIGTYDKLYVIDADSYGIKGTVILTGKITGSSQILIIPNEEIAFVACPNNNSIFVVDLNSRQIIKTIAVTKPYNMIIP